MKLFTAKGFSLALQITSLILLIGYSASKSKNDLTEISKPKVSKIYPSYFKNEHRQYEFPYLNVEIPKYSAEIIKNKPYWLTISSIE
jgi:hypothetical protein